MTEGAAVAEEEDAIIVEDGEKKKNYSMNLCRETLALDTMKDSNSVFSTQIIE